MTWQETQPVFFRIDVGLGLAQQTGVLRRRLRSAHPAFEYEQRKQTQ